MSFSVAVWNRRQQRQHQYTPPLPREDALAYDDFISTSPSPRRHTSGQQEIGNSIERVTSTYGRSSRALRWEKRQHQTPLNPFAHKITSMPEPQVAKAQQERYDAIGAKQFHSHKQFTKEKMAHRMQLRGASYSLDPENTY